MQTNNPMFEELARLMSGAMGTMAGMREEAEAQMRQQIERVFRRLDMVTREDFEAVQEMAATARAEQEALAERVAALETRLAELGGDAAPAKAKARRSPKAASSATTRKRGASADASNED
ncbi:MAG: accessory factor UbiK family protein [Rhodospirillaceae bacterium]|nr:accessory factor UbiK family protein [Rhodospirillaceae bacterium]